ncbi:MAG: hypothetical protein ACR2N4_11585 [Jatrophihabitans sp.]
MDPEQADREHCLDAALVDCGPASPAAGAPRRPGRSWPAGQRYLRPAAGVRLADVAGEVVVLDLASDRYLALGPFASTVLLDLLGAARPCQDGAEQAALEPAVLAGLLDCADLPGEPIQLPSCAEPGGLSSRARATGAPTRAARLATLPRAVATIRGCDRVLRTGGLAGLLDRLRAAAHAPIRRPAVGGPARLAELAASHQRAWQWAGRPHRFDTAAAALALDAWRAGLGTQVVLGVQKYPFHAQLYVRAAGGVVGGPAELATRLAPLLAVGNEPERPAQVPTP